MIKKSKILLVTHKSYRFPHDDLYCPIQVGHASNNLDLGILRDDEGYSISEKNKNFCELTALYWAWKNNFFENYDYVGMVHYRRFFKGQGVTSFAGKILTSAEINTIFQEYDVILPKRRNYWVESIYSHYKNAHNIADLESAKSILHLNFPDYISDFNKVMQGKKLHLYNMFVLRKSDFENYCNWLFTILFELEKKLDITSYDNYQQRVFGFIAERLFNVWIIHNKFRVYEAPVINLEGENYLKKAINLLKRKMLNKGFSNE